MIETKSILGKKKFGQI